MAVCEQPVIDCRSRTLFHYKCVALYNLVVFCLREFTFALFSVFLVLKIQRLSFQKAFVEHVKKASILQCISPMVLRIIYLFFLVYLKLKLTIFIT
jgi:hypothetical protein